MTDKDKIASATALLDQALDLLADVQPTTEYGTTVNTLVRVRGDISYAKNILHTLYIVIKE